MALHQITKVYPFQKHKLNYDKIKCQLKLIVSNRIPYFNQALCSQAYTGESTENTKWQTSNTLQIVPPLQ